MSLYKDEHEYIPDFPKEDEASLSKKRAIRKMLDEKLEAKRKREELDDFDDEFDWSEFDKEK